MVLIKNPTIISTGERMKLRSLTSGRLSKALIPLLKFIQKSFTTTPFLNLF